MFSSRIIQNTILMIIMIQLTACSQMVDDIEHYIAEYNLKGFPSSILYEAIGSDDVYNANTIDKTKLSQYLESRHIQGKAIKIALQYAADQIKGNGGNIETKNSNMTENKMCDYSWVAWLPWSGCPQNEEPEQIIKIDLIKNHSYKCYKGTY